MASPRFSPGELRARTITGFLAAAVVLGLAAVTPWGLWAFGLIVALGGTAELYRLVGVRVRSVMGAWGLFFTLQPWLVAALYLVAEKDPSGLSTYWLGLVLPFALPFTWLVGLLQRPASRGYATATWVVGGWLYWLLPLLWHFNMGFYGDYAPYYHPQLPLGILMLIWACDIAAYFMGKYLGRHPLAPSLSPRKTWEGTLGGLLGALAWALLLTLTWPLHEPGGWWPLAIVVAVFSPLGDLVESAIKRSAGAKDSGTILPGHGGLLDRFDGFALVVPAVFIYRFVVQNLALL